MKTITMYELLGLVKDDKAPKKIKYESREYYLYDNGKYLSTDETRFFDNIYFNELNTEVEILEEEKKIPEKLEPLQKDYMTLDDIKFTFSNSEMILVDKINEIIDYLKSKGE